MQSNMNPLAQAVQSQGRGKDTMLVHMTPGEVAGLQSLAMAHGGSLTINPKTGLAEAGFLDSIFPVIAGVGLMAATGGAASPLIAGMSNAGLVGLGVGGLTALTTGNIEKGLLAGLGAYGGATLGSGLLAAGEATAATQPLVTTGTPIAALSETAPIAAELTAPAAVQGLGQGVAAPVGTGANLLGPATGPQIGTGMVGSGQGFVAPAGATLGPGANIPSTVGLNPANVLAQEAGITTIGQPQPTFLENLQKMGRGISNVTDFSSPAGSQARQALIGQAEKKDKEGQILQQATGLGGGIGAIKTAGAVAAPVIAQSMMGKEEEELPGSKSYITPYAFDYRPTVEADSDFKFRTGAPGESTAEQKYFTPTYTALGRYESGTEPGPSFYGTPTTEDYRKYTQPQAVYKAGGIASLRENDFILPADVISHMGNGSSDAGMEIAITKFRARPIKGDGDGMSDSIPTDIEGKQEALVANEEALIPREMVAFLGGGSVEKGAAKLEKFMDRVRKARTGKKKQAPEIDVARYMPA